MCIDRMFIYTRLLTTAFLNCQFSAASSAQVAQYIGGYLDALGSGASLPGGPGIQNYISSMSSSSSVSASASAVKGYLDNLTSGAAAPSAPAVKSLFESVSAGNTPTGAGISNYLSSLPVSSTVGGAGIASHIASLPSSSYRAGGAGLVNYLDGIGQACDGVKPTSECAEAVSDYMSALSSGDAP